MRPGCHCADRRPRAGPARQRARGHGPDADRAARSSAWSRPAIAAACASGQPTFVWTNLVDFDELFGHRGDAPGFAGALEAFDAALPRLEAALPPRSVLILTADHGNDPTTPGSDHTRERVPVLMQVRDAAGDVQPGRPLGTGATFADHAATVARAFGAAWSGPGTPL